MSGIREFTIPNTELPEISEAELKEVEKVILGMRVPSEQDLLREMKVSFEGPINIDLLLLAWAKNLSS